MDNSQLDNTEQMEEEIGALSYENFEKFVEKNRAKEQARAEQIDEKNPEEASMQSKKTSNLQYAAKYLEMHLKKK